MALEIRTVAITGSTNADLLALASRGAGEGLWLRAEAQSGGRGRQGRLWHSPPGNLYASTLVRLRPGDPPAASLALVAAVALDEALVRFIPADRLQLKWPNDLLCEGAKLSGILLEASGDAVVIGIGVNLAHHPEGLDRPVTSVAAAGAAPPSPQAMLELLGPIFADWLVRWRAEGLDPVRSRWLERAHPCGTALRVAQPDGDRLNGAFDGLEADGALRLRLADGSIRLIHAADIMLA